MRLFRHVTKLLFGEVVAVYPQAGRGLSILFSLCFHQYTFYHFKKCLTPRCFLLHHFYLQGPLKLSSFPTGKSSAAAAVATKTFALCWCGTWELGCGKAGVLGANACAPVSGVVLAKDSEIQELPMSVLGKSPKSSRG